MKEKIKPKKDIYITKIIEALSMPKEMESRSYSSHLINFELIENFLNREDSKTKEKEKQKEKEKEYKIGDYIVKRTLGQGTFGKVKLGIYLPNKEKVAIKILEKKRIIEKDDEIRVKREFDMLAKFNHPNVILVAEIFESADSYYSVMEFCEGGELFNYIVENNRLDEEESSFFFYQIINGLEYIHSLGIVHRDLKPENLLLTKDHLLKIIDFGLSNYFNSKDNKLLFTPCGSPCYASPEMVAGKRYNGFKIDIWSTGIILYAMICGYLPFEDKNNDKLFQKILDCKVKYPKYIGKDAKDILEKILVNDPEKRATIEEIKIHPFFLKGKEKFEQEFSLCQNSNNDLLTSNSAANNYNSTNNINNNRIDDISRSGAESSEKFSKNKNSDINNTKKEKEKEKGKEKEKEDFIDNFALEPEAIYKPIQTEYVDEACQLWTDFQTSFQEENNNNNTSKNKEKIFIEDNNNSNKKNNNKSINNEKNNISKENNNINIEKDNNNNNPNIKKPNLQIVRKNKIKQKNFQNQLNVLKNYNNNIIKKKSYSKARSKSKELTSTKKNNNNIYFINQNNPPNYKVVAPIENRDSNNSKNKLRARNNNLTNIISNKYQKKKESLNIHINLNNINNNLKTETSHGLNNNINNEFFSVKEDKFSESLKKNMKLTSYDLNESPNEKKYININLNAKNNLNKNIHELQKGAKSNCLYEKSSKEIKKYGEQIMKNSDLEKENNFNNTTNSNNNTNKVRPKSKEKEKVKNLLINDPEKGIIDKVISNINENNNNINNDDNDYINEFRRLKTEITTNITEENKPYLNSNNNTILNTCSNINSTSTTNKNKSNAFKDKNNYIFQFNEGLKQNQFNILSFGKKIHFSNSNNTYQKKTTENSHSKTKNLSKKKGIRTIKSHSIKNSNNITYKKNPETEKQNYKVGMLNDYNTNNNTNNIITNTNINNNFILKTEPSVQLQNKRNNPNSLCVKSTINVNKHKYTNFKNKKFLYSNYSNDNSYKKIFKHRYNNTGLANKHTNELSNNKKMCLNIPSQVRKKQLVTIRNTVINVNMVNSSLIISSINKKRHSISNSFHILNKKIIAKKLSKNLKNKKNNQNNKSSNTNNNTNNNIRLTKDSNKENNLSLTKNTNINLSSEHKMPIEEKIIDSNNNGNTTKNNNNTNINNKKEININVGNGNKNNNKEILNYSENVAKTENNNNCLSVTKIRNQLNNFYLNKAKKKINNNSNDKKQHIKFNSMKLEDYFRNNIRRNQLITKKIQDINKNKSKNYIVKPFCVFGKNIIFPKKNDINKSNTATMHKRNNNEEIHNNNLNYNTNNTNTNNNTIKKNINVNICLTNHNTNNVNNININGKPKSKKIIFVKKQKKYVSPSKKNQNK